MYIRVAVRIFFIKTIYVRSPKYKVSCRKHRPNFLTRSDGAFWCRMGLKADIM